MDKWKEFYDFFAANFKKLNENDGISEWARFVNEKVSDMAIIRRALSPLADRYAAGLSNLEPVKAPTLKMVQNAYWSEIRRMKQERDQSRYGANTMCGICRGVGWLFCLSPVNGDVDRVNWPVNYRETNWTAFTGLEMAKCPECGGRYHPMIRQRILDNSLPLVIGRDHRDFPAWVDRRLSSMAGDAAIIETMKYNSGWQHA